MVEAQYNISYGTKTPRFLPFILFFIGLAKIGQQGSALQECNTSGWPAGGRFRPVSYRTPAGAPPDSSRLFLCHLPKA